MHTGANSQVSARTLGQDCQALGWDRLTNGELLRAAEEAGFDVLLTTDNNLAHQQNLKGRKIPIVVLSGNKWSIVKMFLPQIAAAVDGAQPGSYAVVELPANA